MMSKEIEDLIVARAAAMAAHDGEPLEHNYVLYVVGAANALQTDLLAARDNLLKTPSAAPATDPEPEEAPVVLEPEPIDAAPVETEVVADPEPASVETPDTSEAPAADPAPEGEAPAA